MLDQKDLAVDDETTASDLITFMDEAFGIQQPDDDVVVGIVQDETPGGTVTADGRIRFVSNYGVDNAIRISSSGLQMIMPNGTSNPVRMPFGSVQQANGESTVTDFVAHDSLGAEIQVRLTMVLESRDETSSTFRWFADSTGNDPGSGVEIAIGTGQITFDGDGNYVNATNRSATVERAHMPSPSLTFDFDFSQISGLASDSSRLKVQREDGSGPGVLSSFLVGEDGVIRGVFSNGVTRDLGQIQLAQFSNPAGLQQMGENMFAEGVNSGLPMYGDPGESGMGAIRSGATELSNTDIGENLIDLILASTMYRGNTRVITTAQQMLDELLALRR